MVVPRDPSLMLGGFRSRLCVATAYTRDQDKLTFPFFDPRMPSLFWVESFNMPDSPIKVEKVLAELNRLRTDLDKDPTDPEWFALHHAFCFVSYKIGEFQAYLDETVKPGEHPED